MLSQGDQLLQQLKRYDSMKSQSHSTLGAVQGISKTVSSSLQSDHQQESAEEIEEGKDAVRPALGQYKPSHLQPQALQAEEQYTSLKILSNRPKYVPPINFALVEEGIYRSGHPQPNNYQYLRNLKLKTIIYLGDKEDNYEYYKFIKQEGINFKYLKLESSEAPMLYNNPEVLQEALNIVINMDNYPILIHSNKGKHRIGLLVGLMRRFLQGWCLSGIFDEYDKFAGGKGDVDLEFIETFECLLKVNDAKKPSFVRI